MELKIQKLAEKLSPLERKITPFLHLPIKEIREKSGLDETSLIRTLKFLENKNILKIKKVNFNVIDLGTNGIYYKKNQLPERKLIQLLEEKKLLSLEEAKKLSKLSDNEFQVSLGILKNKVLVEIKNEKIHLTAPKEEIIKKTLEEQLLEKLPLQESKLSQEELYALANLKRRKEIIEIKEESSIEIELTPLGKQIAGKEIELDLIEELTPDIIKNWKNNKKFRAYDINSPVPKLYGGKRHFVNQAIEYGRKVWLEMGFKEMTGKKAVTSFWNFDALFTAQDHPVRDMHDTFFIKDIEGKLPDKELLNKVKEAHEIGVNNSKGWRYKWEEKEAKKVVLRTHTTALSARTIKELKNKKGRFFIIGDVYRNETLDINHLFNLKQTEGIVIEKDGNLRQLIGYLKEFYKKMGYEKIRVRPSFFPYTEPSLEIEVYDKNQKKWIELGGAGIFRPEVIVPLLGEYIPVLAWGQGFERIIREYLEIIDIRDMYKNDLKQIRDKKIWIK